MPDIQLIVEDGSMPDGANVYASLEAADAWLVPRGLWPVTGVFVDTDAGTETPDADTVVAKKAALLRAADWINVLPGGRYKGRPAGMERIMAFPRDYAPNTVPGGVRIANMELAAVLYRGEDPFAPLAHGGAIQSESVSTSKVVGPVTESSSRSFSYASDASAETYYPAVAGFLAPYLDKIPGKASGGGCMAVGRG